MAGERTDVVVVGGGPSGLAASCLLAEAGLEVTLLTGKGAVAQEDPRTIALMQPSIRLLAHLGLWPGDLTGVSAPLWRLKIVDESSGLVSTGPVLFDAGMDVGAYFSFSGMITFRNWQWPVRLTDCRTDRLLVETDAPFLAPVPHRGKRNEPAFVREVAAALARHCGAAPEVVESRTTENARCVFGARVAVGL